MEKKILTAIVVCCSVAVIVSLKTEGIPGPDAWLIGWTSWLATVVGIVVGARVFWTGGTALHNLVTTGRFYPKQTNNPP